MTEKFVPTAKAREILGVHTMTLHNWEKTGKIETIRTGGKHRLYNVAKYLRENGSSDEISKQPKKELAIETTKETKNNKKTIGSQIADSIKMITNHLENSIGSENGCDSNKNSKHEFHITIYLCNEHGNNTKISCKKK